jgi:6-pyruvoyltetrahydropterin/6-carboxytetrahydropterin synthase
MHGHSYRLDVALNGPLRQDGPARGMVEDFDTIRTVVRREIVDVLDHQTLNDFIDNPTAEELARWVWCRLEPVFPALDEVVLWETPNNCAVLRRSDSERA